jgi:uncharacterized protein DUF2200
LLGEEIAQAACLRDEVFEGISDVRSESGTQEPDEGGSRPDHLLVDGLYSSLIQGVVCGVRLEEIEDPLMRKVRCLDKLIDELAKGKAMEKILRE